MSTLSDLLAEHTALSGSAVAHLQRLVSEWQLLADLSFSDLLIWVPTGPDEFICVAQVRPTTWTTVHLDDLVSRTMSVPEAMVLRRSWEEEHIVGATVPGDETVQREVIPVRHADAAVALLVRDTAVRADLARSALDTAYLEAADDLFRWSRTARSRRANNRGRCTPDRGPGTGCCGWTRRASWSTSVPNAVSAYHRLGLAGGLSGPSWPG